MDLNCVGMRSFTVTFHSNLIPISRFQDCTHIPVVDYKLHIQNCRLDVRIFSFARRVCPVWNTLPTEVVNACSISSFKYKLDAVNLDLYSRY